MRRSYRRNRAGGLLLLLFVFLFVVFGVASGSSAGLLPVGVGEGTALALTVVGEVVLFSQSIRLQAQARREAALFHGLPVSAARYVPEVRKNAWRDVELEVRRSLSS